MQDQFYFQVKLLIYTKVTLAFVQAVKTVNALLADTAKKLE